MSNYSAALQNLTDETWRGLQVDEKLAILRAIEQETALREGRQPCKVVGEFIPSNEDGITLGYYNRGTRLITINTEQLDPRGKYGNDYGRMVNTILHEGRHAYQHQAVAGEIDHDDKQELATWADNMQPGHYITYERNPRGYFNQPIERDARSFAEERLRLLEEEKARIADEQIGSELRLTQGAQKIQEAGAQNIESISGTQQDDFWDKGIQIGAESETMIERKRIELQMEFERDASGAFQSEESERALIEEQETGIQVEQSLSSEYDDARAEIEDQEDTIVKRDSEVGQDSDIGQEQNLGISY